MTVHNTHLVRVNLGCGDRYADGWVNVDHESPHRADVRWDLRVAGPLTPMSVSHTYAGHVFEHITIEESADLLKRILEYTVPLGELMVVGPDCNVALEMIENGAGLAEMWGATLDSLRFGAGRWAGDEHHWFWTQQKMGELMIEAGWSDVTPYLIDTVPSFWPVADRRPQWQRAVWGRRGVA